MDKTFGPSVAAQMTGGPAIVVVCGLLVTAVLVWSVWFGIRVRRAESAPPRPEEQPSLPASGPVREERQQREPNEVPRAVHPRDRLTPYQIGNSPDRPRRDDTDDGPDSPPHA
ncbi:DUF6479 family protein [Streptomyces sp. NPDC004539]|uniref:DUF6479 family protein n=1 Tax=Streptomyces sp. NPDC004539 TaxID=3154280 RepID=UPI0033BAC707